MVNPLRIRQLNDSEIRNGPIIYWMQRDQRAFDNWALLFAQDLAIKMNQPLIIVFCLVPGFLNATVWHFRFMLDGLREVKQSLFNLNIPFILLKGIPTVIIPEILSQVNAGGLVTDFNPLHLTRQWKTEVIKQISVPVFEVDAHNILPCWEISDKQEYAAFTFRKKVEKRLSEFLVDFPKLSIHPCLFEDFHKEFITENSIPVDWNALIPETTNRSKGTGLLWISPGEHAATLASAGFIADGLDRYAENRNYPDLKGQSDLSPYLHFGQISSHRLALDLSNAGLNHESKQAFLEELIVRRELSDNFCYYNAHYDTVDGFPSWAKLTLKKHRDDPRDFIYSTEQFENAETHDDLWNSAQRQMVRTGKMHGFLRMYWAKKILEWTAEPEVAMAIAIYLNDKYEFDGRDPNGYAGIAWSIGGVHDRPWGERRVFGMIRYMNYQGCKRKFDVGKYIRQNELY